MKRKKLIALLLAFTMTLTAMPLTAFANGIAIAPMLALSNIMTTSVDAEPEIAAEQIFDVTVKFRSAMSPNGEPFTITATNGAEILINDPSDVTAVMGTNPGIIRDISNVDGVVRFITSTPATTPAENTIIFQVKAPQTAGDFSLSTKIGLDTTPNSSSNFATKTLTVAINLTVDTSHDVVIGDKSFEIFGEIGTTLPPGYYYVGFAATHIVTGYYAVDGLDIVYPGDSYSFTSSFPPTAPEGIYVVTVMLFNLDYIEVATVTKEIEYKFPSFELTATPSAIENDTPFVVSGNIGFANPNGDYRVGFVVVLEGADDPVLEGIATPASDGSYSYSGLVFPSTAVEGTYVVKAVLLDAGDNIIRNAQIEIEYSKVVLTPSIDFVGTQVGSVTAPNGGSVTFPIFTSNIPDDAYSVSLSGAPAGVTGNVVVNSDEGTLTLSVTSAVAAGTYPFEFSITVAGETVTANVTLNIGGTLPIARITLSIVSGGTPNITYNEGPRHRVNRGNTLTVSGTAYDEYNNPVAAGQQIIARIRNLNVGVLYPPIPKDGYTDDNGNFSIQVQSPLAGGLNSFIVMTNPASKHFYDLGIVSASASTSNGTVTSNEIPIYIWDRSDFIN